MARQPVLQQQHHQVATTMAAPMQEVNGICKGHCVGSGYSVGAAAAAERQVAGPWSSREASPCHSSKAAAAAVVAAEAAGSARAQGQGGKTLPLVGQWVAAAAARGWPGHRDSNLSTVAAVGAAAGATAAVGSTMAQG